MQYIHIKTQRDYRRFMAELNCTNYKWGRSIEPSKRNNFEIYKDKTVIVLYDDRNTMDVTSTDYLSTKQLTAMREFPFESKVHVGRTSKQGQIGVIVFCVFVMVLVGMVLRKEWKK